MDAAAVISALRAGDIGAFVSAVEWDDRYVPDIPAEFRGGLTNPFLGRFGVVTVGTVQREDGSHRLSLHTHPDVETAQGCMERQMVEVKQTLALAALMLSMESAVTADSEHSPMPGMYV